MISVCMATYNGEKHIQCQLQSILGQLGMEDEIIISDDGSTDGTMDEIRAAKDHRIRLFSHHQSKNIAANFENALKRSHGKYIFLADQDDIWHGSKLKICKNRFKKGAKLIVTNAAVINESEKKGDGRLYFGKIKPGAGLMKNFVKNSYLGCCMAFDRDVLRAALPFPEKIVMHDIWIGLVAEMMAQPVFIDMPLVYYRRHGNNISPAFEKSQYPLSFKLKYRFQLICELVRRFGISAVLKKGLLEIGYFLRLFYAHHSYF